LRKEAITVQKIALKTKAILAVVVLFVALAAPAGAAIQTITHRTNDISIHRTPAADLWILIISVGDHPRPGDQAEAEIIVSNAGAVPTKGKVTVTVNYPTLSSVELAGTGWRWDAATKTASRTDALAPNDSYPPLSLMFRVPSDAKSNIVMKATVSGGGDASPNNNTGSGTMSLDRTPYY